MREFVSILIVMCLSMNVGAQEPYKWSPPIFVIDSLLFNDSAKVELVFGDKNAQLMIAINGGNPKEYVESIFVSETSKLEAFVFGRRVISRRTLFSSDVNQDTIVNQDEMFLESDHVFADVVKNGKVIPDFVNKTKPSEKYPESNGELTNRIGASKSYADVQWVGYDSDSIVFEFKTTEKVKEIGLVFLTDVNAWILPPMTYHIKCNEANGTKSEIMKFEMIGEVKRPKSPQKHPYFIQVGTKKGRADWRLVLYPSRLPKSHPGSGKNAWIFIDELIIN